MDKELQNFFNDDGAPINPNLASKPSLCTSCKYDSEPEQETPCILNRMDQQGEYNFECEAYEKK